MGSMMTPAKRFWRWDDPERWAFHDAGHLVAEFALQGGIRGHRISIARGNPYACAFAQACPEIGLDRSQIHGEAAEELERDCLVTMAGSQAEGRLTGRIVASCSGYDSGRLNALIPRIEAFMSERYGLRREQIWEHIARKADALVEQHLTQVEQLAQVLLRDTEVPGSQVLDLLSGGPASSPARTQ